MRTIQAHTQAQEQTQKQELTSQQVQLMRMLEKPLPELEQRVADELNDNEALTAVDTTQEYQQPEVKGQPSTVNRQPSIVKGQRSTVNNQPSIVKSQPSIDEALPDDETLYQQLLTQVAMLDLTDDEKELMEYLIGNLDDNGYISKPAFAISEELALFQGINAEPQQIEQLINLLQTFDPPGIGAHDMQEALLLQTARRRRSAKTAIMKRILTDYYQEFMQRKWQIIYKRMDEDEDLVTEAIEEIRRLNPRPGAHLGEGRQVAAQQVTPDCIIETTDDDQVTFTLNYGKIPRLAVAEDYDDLIRQFESIDREKMRKQEYEAYNYTRSKVRKAEAFIRLISLRFATLAKTMQAIINHQQHYLLSGDENDLQPLKLKDIADEIGYGISTSSRVCQSKYVQTEWGILPMKHFFTQSYGDGNEEHTLQQILTQMQDIINNEDKRHPLSDDKIAQLMNKNGYGWARRTVAKHRERLGIPPARLRKRV